MALIDIVKHEGPNDVLVWKWPKENLALGNQIVVNQTQEALLYKSGQALDLLGPGRHTLVSANVPLLRSVLGAALFGGSENTPVPVEIYFIDKAVLLDVKWGTPRPVPILDPLLNVFLPVRANGQFGFKVVDSRSLVTQLVGTVPTLAKDDVTNYFRGVILTKTKDYIAAKLIDERLSILTVTAHLNEMSAAIKDKLQDDFKAFGLEIVNFFVNSIDVPDDDPEVQKVKAAMANKAEYRIMGEDAYRVKRTFDVLEEAAKNTSGGGNMIGTGMGFGMGMGAGQGFANLAGGLIGAVSPSKNALPAPSSMMTCPTCKTEVFSAYKFCTTCGGALVTANAVCPGCQNEVPVGGKFCGHCGLKLAASLCPNCKHEVPAAAAACPGCGQKLAAEK